MKVFEMFKNFKVTKVIKQLRIEYLIDILVFCGTLFISYIFTEKPEIERDYKRFFITQKIEKIETRENKENITDDKQEIKFILEKKIDLSEKVKTINNRNPFSLEGSYINITLPEEPFKLVAVKTKPEKEAILQSFKGDLIKVKEKDILFDGSKVIKIDYNKVILQKDKKKKELKLFYIEVDKWRPKKLF